MGRLVKNYFLSLNNISLVLSATYGLNSDNTIRVENREYYLDRQTDNVVIGKARCPTSEAKCKVNFGAQSWYSFLTEGNYWVLDTDYTSYTVIYSCT